MNGKTYRRRMVGIVAGILAGLLSPAPATAQPLDARVIAERVADVWSAAKTMPKRAGRRANVLLIIADDIGVEKSRCYDFGTDLAPTPNLSHMCRDGVVFENVWSTPVCSSTRATIMTGRYGFRTGVGAQVNSRLGTGPIRMNEFSIADAFNKNPALGYAPALIGKWHLSEDPHDPAQMGWKHHAGLLRGGVRSYWDWPKTVNGRQSRSDKYVTTEFIDDAIDWIGKQGDKPWFMWLALTAPHSPFHAPPRHLHTYRNLPEDQSRRSSWPALYNAMVESMDTEIGRLFLALGADGLANTNIIYVGDNGTAPRVAGAPITRRKAKGSLYQGGIQVPMFVAGPDVADGGRRVKELVTTTDIFATVLELAGLDLAKTIPAGAAEDSVSFAPYLRSPTTKGRREWAFAELFNAPRQRTRRNSGHTVRDAEYKFIRLLNGRKEFYHVADDPHENNNLAANMSAAEKARYDKLSRQLDAILATGR